MPGSYWRKAIGALACLALLCGTAAAVPAAGKAEAQDVKVFTILHTNDEHSDLIPYGPAIDYPDHPTYGGISRIAYEMERIRAEKAAAGEPVLTLSGGDFCQGTMFSWLMTTAAAELSVLQAMGYDAVVLGNHEFDLGPAYLAGALGVAKGLGIRMPLLSANINIPAGNPLEALFSATDLQGTELAIQRYTIKELPNGLKVGILGLLGAEAEAVAPAAAPVTFGNIPGDPTDPMGFINRVIRVQNTVNTLRAQDCDVVVVLSHSGTEEEVMLPRFVSGIDVVVGGHSHDLNYPPIMVGDTIVVQAGAYTSHLGVLELEYAGGKVSVRNADAIRIDDSIPTHPGIDAMIEAYKAGLDGAVGFDVLAPFAGTSIAGDGGFNLNDGPPMAESNLGDLITDAYMATAAAFTPPDEPIRMAFEANGVIRSSIPRGANGVFSFYDLFRALPLGGSPYDASKLGYPMVSFHLLGAEVMGVLEATLAMGSNTFFVQLAGAQVHYRPAGPDGGRLVSFEVSDGAGGWEPLDPGALYKVATNYYTASFLALFGVGPRDKAGAPTTLEASRLIKPDTTDLRCWEALAGYIQNMPDLDGDGIPNVPPDYRFPQHRITAAGWYLAEGSTAGGMETFVLVQNPGDDDVKVNVVFQTGEGQVAPADLQGVTIPANSRRTFKANEWVTTFDVSTMVEPIDGDVIVERAVYGDGRTWAHDCIGVTAPSPSPQWYLAEGSTAGGMETWLLVQNPYKSAARVNIVFQTDTGKVAPPGLQGVTIPASSRATFNLGQWVPDNYNVSTYVLAEDGLVVCERAMYGDNRTWAHNSIGTPAVSGEWYLAEGSTAGGMETFVLVQNPTAAAVKVNIAFNTDIGDMAPVDLQGVTIPADSRRTFKVNEWVTSYDVSTYVECLDGAVVVERAMYGDGRAWAHASVGAPMPTATWYLAEGSTAGGMETFVLVQNPTATAAKVNVVFQTGEGSVAPAALQGVTIPAFSRRTFKVNDWVTTFDVSTTVEATEGSVVVERAMYGDGRAWAHNSIGFGIAGGGL